MRCSSYQKHAPEDCELSELHLPDFIEDSNSNNQYTAILPSLVRYLVFEQFQNSFRAVSEQF